MKKFKFNDCGMCENPEEEELYTGPEGSITVFLAERKGLWCHGYDYNFKNPYRGGGSAAGFGEYRETYASRDEAFNAVINEMSENIKEDFPRIAYFIAEPRQQLLFPGQHDKRST